MSGSDPGVDVRPARAADLPGILELVRQAGLPAAGLEESGIDLLVATDRQGALLGVAGVETHGVAGLLRSVATRPGARGGGIGSRLVRACIERAGEHGLEELYLLTETAADWFPRFGFRPLPRDSAPEAMRRSAEFASICPSSAVCMRRPLGSGGA